ncbi:HAD hydrolase-like protein [Enterovibrio norvegicus]|uniref:HAD hydrolase-like protein n=1 Tax=Enterovibrio norvegicus TaxID=188144 RepID=UPI0024B0E477|nr:HAD hydrolase-like protein [Enterovibrio norvegicus]
MILEELTIAENVTHIFTDFFDTIVSRKCHPEEIKRKWCKHLISLTNIHETTESIYKLRLNVEGELATQALSQHGVSEFKYLDMLDKLLRIVGVCEKQINSIKRELYRAELSLEKRNQFINTDVVTFLTQQKKLGKKITVVSDFYCSKEFLSELIVFHGVDELIDEVYVSSDAMRTKRESNFYDYVLKSERVEAKNVIMIGDNLHSDVEMSKSKGIYGIHIKRDFRFYKESLDKDKKTKNIRQEINRIFSQEKSNFTWMGIPIFIFIVELYTKLKINSAKEVVFLAREGEFLKEIFDIYLRKIGDSSISTKYMYASRRGTYLPSLFELNEDCFDKFLNQYPRNSIETLLKTLSLDSYISGLELDHPEINFKKTHEVLKLSEDFKALLNSDAFVKIFRNESQERRKYLNNYVETLIDNDDVIHLVDVGWKGSIQDNIQKATNRKVFGYYCGLLSGAYTNEKNIKHGILFEETKSICNGFGEFNEFRASFEVFCAASHGSLVRYEAYPKVATLEDNEYEIELYKKSIRPIQVRIKTILDTLFYLNERYSISNENLYDILVPIYFKRMMLPSTNELFEFSQYKHYENFGCFDFSKFDEKRTSRLGYIKQLIRYPKLTIGREWWKPLGFWIHGVSFLKYPYYALKFIRVRCSK